MDFIEGGTVDTCWDNLSPEKRTDVVDQVASMMDTLPAIPLPDIYQDLPGPVGEPRCLAHGTAFDQWPAGRFESMRQLEGWFGSLICVAETVSRGRLEETGPFQFGKLVLTHQEIIPRSLILDGEGSVWLTNWANSGIYPERFDYLTIKAALNWSNPEFVRTLLERIPNYEDLRRYIWRIGGRERWGDSFDGGVGRCSLTF